MVYEEHLHNYLAHLHADGCNDAVINDVDAHLQWNRRQLEDKEYPLGHVSGYAARRGALMRACASAEEEGDELAQ